MLITLKIISLMIFIIYFSDTVIKVKYRNPIGTSDTLLWSIALTTFLTLQFELWK